MQVDLRGLKAGKHRLRCPECNKGAKDDALSVELRADGSAVWWCWRCHSSGGTRGNRVLTMHSGSRPKAPDPQDEARRQASAMAACRAIWKQTQPIAGTLGEQYLRLRECALPPADGDLRFHAALFCRETGTDLPALVAKVTTVIGNVTIGVHRIWIRPGEAKAIKKMRLGSCTEPVCIRLWPNVGRILGIAEGVETACALARTMTPMWSTVDAGQMTRFPILPGLVSLVIFADRDKAGLLAAGAAHDRYTAAGKDARYIYPRRAGEDFNDTIIRQVRA